MKRNTYQQEQIQPILVKYIAEANASIQLAVGWLEDDGLLSLLEKKSTEGVQVSLLLFEKKKNNKGTDFQDLRNKGIQITKLDEAQREYFMDHKFGLIDSSIVLTGNYAWGHKNAPLEESLSVTENLSTLATGFSLEFDYLTVKNDLPKNEPKPVNPIIRLLKKTEVLKVLLEIGDTKYIYLRLRELKKYAGDPSVDLIVQKLRGKEFEEASELIKKFTRYHKYLRECLEPPIDNLRREIRILEDEIAALSNEFNETQKSLHKFSKLHTNYLGELLQELLLQNKIKAELEAAANPDPQKQEELEEELEEATKDHEEYTASHEAAKKEKFTVLTPQEQKELKKLYRQSSLKCHPDRIVVELHDQAEAIFVELNHAYKSNNLERVREINEQLKSGIMLSKSEGITELKKLESTYKTLNQKMEDWQKKLEELQATPSYHTIKNIEDWDTYFMETKAILEQQLERLKEVNAAGLEE